ncbi:Ribonucleases P/MRP protein subunit pop3 [Madurella mycetomatis]|uniref:Ribonucleases P/MRP protein subunit pop3 n=1 Tax=Madurella mycetomatis TaxID=100816 RepID=A0A175VV03_9PEZI|nr:Ribonucleases P/MRP protein subunit pop3 [Madurella mycetomatis]
MERKRIVHVLDTPYTAVEWPQVSQEDQDAILELLCRLLTPLGIYRKSSITPSKGKRRRSRNKVKAPGSELPAAATPAPPAPELAAHVDVGLSKISRTLQHMSAKKDGVGQTAEDAAAPYSAVFVARSGQSPAFHCHFPQMIALAAQSQSPEKAVRLVGFSKSCEERLSAALGIPRASSIGLREDAPQAKGLIDFVREHVAPVQVPWLDEARSAKFLETNIDAVPTRIGNKKPRLS